MQTPPPGAQPPPNQQGPFQYGPGYPPPPPPPGYMPPPPYYWAPPPPPPPPIYKWGPSSMNIDPNILAGLGYLFPIVGIVFFFVEKSNRYVKFHAAQSALIAISYFILTLVATVLIFGGVILSIVNTTSTINSDSNGVLIGATFNIILFAFQALIGILALAHLGLQIWGTVAGFTGTFVSMPLIGPIAERWAGGRPVPVY